MRDSGCCIKFIAETAEKNTELKHSCST